MIKEADKLRQDKLTRIEELIEMKELLLNIKLQIIVKVKRIEEQIDKNIKEL